MNTNKNERFFDINGILRYAFKDVKKIIIILVVGVLLGAGFGILTKRVYKVQENSTNASIQAARENLSASRISEIDDIYTTYKNLIDQRKNFQDHLNNSIYLNLNETTAKTNTIVFSLSGNNRMNAIIDSYTKSIKKEDLYKNINKSLNKNIAAVYLSELINISEGGSSSNNTTNVIIDGKTDRSVVVTIYGININECKKITSCIRKEFSDYTKKLKKTYGNFSIIASSDSYAPVNSTDITEARATYDDKLASISTTITNMTYYLNDDQKTYLNALIDANVTTTESNTKVVQVIDYKKVISLAIAGAILLFIIYFIIKTFIYMMSHRLHTENEFTNYFGINIIEMASYKNNTDFNVATEEMLYLAKKSNQKIGLLSSIDHYDYVNKVYETVSKTTDSCEIVSASPTMKDEFDKLLEIDSVVIFEELGKSKIENIQKMLRYYELKGINVVGAILIQK